MLAKTVFERYSNNLHLLVNKGLLPGIRLKYDRTYICPICLKQFSEDDLNPKGVNHLSREHNPPEALGGGVTCLTCKSCNNRSGSSIDIHLLERLINYEKNLFLPYSEAEVRFSEGENRIKAKLKIGKSKYAKSHLLISEKNNNKSVIEQFNENINGSKLIGGQIIKVELVKRKKIDFERIPIALLKIAYLLAFEKFGYLLII